jgi:hypothetical protein
MKPVRLLLCFLLLLAAAHPAVAQGRIAVGQTATGELSAGDGTTAAGAHHDDWTFQAELGERYRVTLRSDDFDAYLRVGPRGRDGCAPCERDDDGAGGTDAMVELVARVHGPHVIRVTSYRGGQTGGYTLRLEQYDPYAGPASDTTLVPWTVTDADTTEGFPSVVPLPGDTSGYEPVPLDTTAVVWPASADTAVAGPADTTLWAPALADTAAGPIVSPRYHGEPRYLDARVPEEGVLDERSAVGEDGAYHEVWLYRGRRSETVTFTLESDDFDTVLRVLRYSPGDGGMRLVGSDDDGGTATNSELTLTFAEEAVYELHAGAYRPGAAGRYTLTTTVRTAGEEQVAPPRLILPGPGETSELSKFHPRGQNGAPMEVWVFGGEAGWVVTIEMRSNDFDTVLRVLEEQDGVAGRELASDDDGGGGTNSRVVMTLPRTGGYLVHAGAFAPDASGTYTLILRVQQR